MDGNFSQVCPVVLRDHFRRGMIKKLWQVNGLMLSNSILMGFVVYIGVFQPRARRNPIISFLLLGASTLFLPIVSNVAASIGKDMYFTSSLYNNTVLAAKCEPVLFLSEMKDIVYYVCSNWSKVALICRYLKHPPSPAMKKCIAFVVNCCRCKLVNSWNDTLSQCSILVHRPWWKPNWHLWHVKCLPSMVGDFPLWRLFGFPEQESTKELSTVKKSIFEALRNEDVTAEQEEGVKHIRLPSLIRVSGLAISGSQETVAGTVLAWHIATSLWELKDHEPERSTANGSIEQSSDSDNKIVATQLSRYCAYLVACRPELLPDEDDYCQKLYGDVLKHAHRVLRVAGAGAGFELLVLLMRGQLDELRRVDMDNGGSWTLKNGADLAEQLVDLNMGWKELAEFWSEMILYIAPSENLDGHGEAIARGGEMVTLLWALLAHAGIVDRHVEVAADTDTVVAADASNSDPSGLVNGTAADLRIGDRLVGMTTDANTAAAADASNAGEERITIVTVLLLK
ncbi:hypothetical protein QOZ80_7BG0584780 [Eleusine coracana subsp. coracana]|nr:hypothetical protein QOZ80_7BG0584780 [Eleusine coracana subsp. coracana]